VPITFDEQGRSWLLSTPNSSYGLALTGHASVAVHLHWGRPLDHGALAAIAAGPFRAEGARAGWGEAERLEYVGWGGMRYDEPSLKVDFADGTRGIEWELTDTEVADQDGAATLCLGLVDQAYPFRAEIFYRVFDDTDVIERWARLVHTGDAGPIVVRQAHAANWWLPDRRGWRLSYLHGAWGSETQLGRRELVTGKVVLESRRGTTSHQLQPFFALDPEGSASEGHGDVWSGQLAWSGSWKIVAETSISGTHVSGGWNDFDAPVTLKPGDEMVLPVFAGCYVSGGFGAMSRAWHDYELRHVLSHRSRTGGSPSFPAAPRPGPPEEEGQLPPLRPVLYNSWEATTFAVSDQGQAQLAVLAADIGAELFVVDDGWFQGRHHDRAGLGDWTVDRGKFPAGLGPLVQQVAQLGMRFGIWVEPEMVNPDSDLYRAHPDWVFHFPGRACTERRNQLVLNLARPDVAEWIYQTLDQLLGEHGISFVKWDMNRHVSEPGWPDMVADNPERAWVDYVHNLYDIWDRLRAAHPSVEFESCSGGGGRVDLGMLSRCEQVWTSDNTDAWDRTIIQEGFSYAHAAMAMMAWVTDSPNPLTGRRLPLSYRFHVAMLGSLGIGGDLTQWSSAELAEAKSLVATYKDIRPVVQHGRLYRLASTRSGPVGAVQYMSRDSTDVVVLAWAGPRHFPPSQDRDGVRLTGLDRAGVYRDVATGQDHFGATLEEVGLRLPGNDFSSLLLHLKRL
jgi:alpha-galactosidase